MSFWGVRRPVRRAVAARARHAGFSENRLPVLAVML
jgi:hypothetical protein